MKTSDFFPVFCLCALEITTLYFVHCTEHLIFGRVRVYHCWLAGKGGNCHITLDLLFRKQKICYYQKVNWEDVLVPALPPIGTLW